MKTIRTIVLSLLIIGTPLVAAQPMSSMRGPSKIITNNRILYTINGKSISVLDLKKKMDVVFYQQFPQFVRNIPARYQFYQNNWVHVLNQMIDTELVLNDAEEKKLPVSDMDIRTEMEDTFGSNPLEVIDTLDLTYKEAWEQMKKSILVQRMMYYNVRMKTHVEITPSEVENEYKRYIEKQTEDDSWVYQVLTIKNNDEKAATTIADRAYELLTNEKTPLNNLKDTLEHDPVYGEGTQISLSTELSQNSGELSEAYRKVLTLLPEGFYSSPVKHLSLTSNSDVIRIFYLKEHIKPEILPLAQIQESVKDSIHNKAMERETIKYLDSLRHRYEITQEDVLEFLPENFNPFSLN